MPLAAAAIVPAVCVPWPWRSSHAAGCVSGAPVSHETVRAKSRLVDVRVILVDPRVDVAHDDGGAAARDRMRLRRGDLAHIPLQRGQGVAEGGRRVRQLTRGRTVAGGGRLSDPRRELLRRGGRAVDPPVPLECIAEAGRGGARDDDPDLRVGRHEVATGARHALTGVGGNRVLLVDDEPGLGGRRRCGSATSEVATARASRAARQER